MSTCIICAQNNDVCQRTGVLFCKMICALEELSIIIIPAMVSVDVKQHGYLLTDLLL